MRLLLLTLLVATPSFAADAFEIQVYGPDINAPGQLALEVHFNSTMTGRKTPAWAGEVVPRGANRLTLEPALGVTDWLELGAYVQGFLGYDNQAHFGGLKLRAKMVLPRQADDRCFAGLNVELGLVPVSVEEHGWANELRPFLGCEAGRWQFTVNPIIGYALSGPDAFLPEFEPAGKVAFNTNRGFGLGLEYYAALGYFHTLFTDLSAHEHLAFLTFDLMPPAGETASDGAWELNVGVGHGLTPSPDRGFVVKAIVGHVF